MTAWLKKAGTHCQAVHEHLVLQPQVLQHVEVDELFVRTQHQAGHSARGRRLYLFSALCVSTRLWLGGFLSTRRDETAARRLAQIVHRAAALGPLLVVFDGFRYYGRAFRRAFRWRFYSGRAGHPRLVPWSDLVLIQYVKQGGLVRLVQGTWHAFVGLWPQVGHRVVSTSYIERPGATFRSRLATLARRTRHLGRSQETLEAALYLVGSVYNFCSWHKSLSRTPAMAAGLVDERWSVGQLLWYRVPPPRWRPPPHKGAYSREERRLMALWCT